MTDDDEVSALQRAFKDRTAVVQALSRDLAKYNRTIDPQVLLARRIEFLVNALFPSYIDAMVDGPPTTPDRLRFELAWLDMLEPLYRGAIREAITVGSNGIIRPPHGGPQQGGRR